MSFSASEVHYIGFLTVKALVGTAVLSYPYVLRICGMAVGVLLIGLCSLSALFSCGILLKTADLMGVHSLAGLARQLYGSRLENLLNFIIFVYSVGSLVAVFNVVGDTLGPMLEQFGDSVLLERSSILVFTSLLTVFFCCNPHPIFLEAMNTVSVVIYFLFGFFLFFLAYHTDWVYDHLVTLDDPLSALSLFPDFSLSSIFSGYPIIAFGFSCQQNLFLLGGSVKNHHVLISAGVFHGICITTLLYLSVAIWGYMLQYQDTQPNLLLNLPHHHGLFYFLLKLGFIFTNVVTGPIIVSPAIRAMQGLRAMFSSFLASFRSEADASKREMMMMHRRVDERSLPVQVDFFYTVFFVFQVLLISLCVSELDVILGLLGSTTSIFISYIFPSLLFIKAVERMSLLFNYSFYVMIAKFHILLGIFIAFTSTTEILYSSSS